MAMTDSVGHWTVGWDFLGCFQRGSRHRCSSFCGDERFPSTEETLGRGRAVRSRPQRRPEQRRRIAHIRRQPLGGASDPDRHCGRCATARERRPATEGCEADYFSSGNVRRSRSIETNNSPLLQQPGRGRSPAWGSHSLTS